MSACDPRDTGVEALATNRGSAPPFLPTLVTAILIGAASLLCRQPSAPESPAAPIATVEASLAGTDGFHPAPGAREARVAVPAFLAFAQLQPLTFQAPRLAEAAAVPAARATRPAGTERRTCGTARCGEAKRGETIRSASSVAPPVRSASEPSAIPQPLRDEPEAGEDLLPQGALPFASTAASWIDGARKLGGSIGKSVGSGAVSLGGSVVDLLASAR